MLHTARGKCDRECHCSGSVNDKSMRDERRFVRRNRVLGSEGVRHLHRGTSEDKNEEHCEHSKTWRDQCRPCQLLQRWHSAGFEDSACWEPVQASATQAQDCSAEHAICGI
jgi:hypothetical protein